MKKAMVTRADNRIEEISILTHPILKDFAKRWDAEFIVLNQPVSFRTDDNHEHYRILQVRDLLQDYDRILSIDTDVLIANTCPNPFETVPEDCISCIYEDKGSRLQHRRGVITTIQQQFGDIGWRTGYLNTGIMVLSKEHSNLFNPINGKYYTNWGSDDAHFGYNLNKYKLKFQELNYKFNHMGMFSEPWNNNASRFDSYIIHYAGSGIFDKQFSSKLENIIADRNILYP
jgi:lipopolysaccharide biosynthesis glycosyltransferase